MRYLLGFILLCAGLHAQTAATNFVFIISENQSFDGMCLALPADTNCASSGMSKRAPVALYHRADPPLANCDHSYSGAIRDIDGGLMDGFAAGCKVVNGINQSYTQLYCTDLPWLCDLANNRIAGLPVTVLDEFFESELGASWASHAGIVSGSSQNVVGIPTNSKYWGCDAPVGTTVLWKNPATGKNSQVAPCFTAPTIADLAQAAGVSLRFYGATSGQPGYQFVAPTYFSDWIGNPTEWSEVHDVANFESDVAAGELAQITIITPKLIDSGHPLYSMAVNEAWLKSKMLALQASPQWPTTVVVLTWDDFGGWYDHVPPPPGDGLRVPGIVVSQLLTHPGTTFHGTTDFGSVLQLIEQHFGMGCLTFKDCNASSLSSLFQ